MTRSPPVGCWRAAGGPLDARYRPTLAGGARACRPGAADLPTPRHRLQVPNGAKRQWHCAAGKVSGQMPAQQSRLLPAYDEVRLSPAQTARSANGTAQLAK